MRLNPDCVRDVLLTVESCSFDERLRFEGLCGHLPKYSPEELQYTCLKLKEAEYLVLVVTTKGTVRSSFPGIVEIRDITYRGHEFLANIRKESIWNGVKDVAGKIGCTSLSALTQIASNIATELIKAHFGLI